MTLQMMGNVLYRLGAQGSKLEGLGQKGERMGWMQQWEGGRNLPYLWAQGCEFVMDKLDST